MKRLIGLFAVVISLAFIVVLILRLWNIEMLSLQTILRSSFTLIVLGISALLLIIIYGAFFRNSQAGFDEKKGNHAHPKS
ncbi:hypothetical protein [Pedobacter agri]|uniref:Uncharacterized protein n=1 Tax=Pedobacter agri TaxID=454586 RepID=A0A9X3DCW7_9SPHI|nr:hypothetical protein [Pedobacter agri]MCX3264860.1 hypothetical protein [Pedobacter agri]